MCRRSCLKGGGGLRHFAIERQVLQVREKRLEVVGSFLLGFKLLGLCGLKGVPFLKKTEAELAHWLPTVQQHGRGGFGTSEQVRKPCSCFSKRRLRQDAQQGLRQTSAK